mmetsp:Transcript_37192/g.111351  ORF Transcript_37192/g.111351 Transcript_37192/m.111351 type:complete len:224 (-) Transcript_37192:219-890(-)
MQHIAHRFAILVRPAKRYRGLYAGRDADEVVGRQNTAQSSHRNCSREELVQAPEGVELLPGLEPEHAGHHAHQRISRDTVGAKAHALLLAILDDDALELVRLQLREAAVDAVVDHVVEIGRYGLDGVGALRDVEDVLHRVKISRRRRHRLEYEERPLLELQGGRRSDVGVGKNIIRVGRSQLEDAFVEAPDQSLNPRPPAFRRRLLRPLHGWVWYGIKRGVPQ